MTKDRNEEAVGMPEKASAPPRCARCNSTRVVPFQQVRNSISITAVAHAGIGGRFAFVGRRSEPRIVDHGAHHVTRGAADSWRASFCATAPPCLRCRLGNRATPLWRKYRSAGGAPFHSAEPSQCRCVRVWYGLDRSAADDLHAFGRCTTPFARRADGVGICRFFLFLLPLADETTP